MSTSLQVNELLADGVRKSVSFIHPTERWQHGVTPDTRRVLTEDEEAWCDWDAVRRDIAAELGFPWEFIAEHYCHGRTGRQTTAFGIRRDQLDAALLRVKESGGNMSILSRALGWYASGEDCVQMRKTLKRARVSRAAATQAEQAVHARL